MVVHISVILSECGRNTEFIILITVFVSLSWTNRISNTEEFAKSVNFHSTSAESETKSRMLGFNKLLGSSWCVPEIETPGPP